MRLFKNLFVLSLFLTLAGCASSSRPGDSVETGEGFPVSTKVASADVVKVTIDPIEIPAGGSAEATVRLTIQEGFHLNANPPTYPYLIATELNIPPADGVSVGFISYPDGISRKFEFAEEPLSVFEGETSLRVLLNADKSALQGPVNLSGELRVQACDDEVCYPPGKLQVTIPTTIK